MRRYGSAIIEDIAVVLGPSERPSPYLTGEGFWRCMTSGGKILHVSTRRIPQRLRWNREMVRGYFKDELGI